MLESDIFGNSPQCLQVSSRVIFEGVCVQMTPSCKDYAYTYIGIQRLLFGYIVQDYN